LPAPSLATAPTPEASEPIGEVLPTTLEPENAPSLVVDPTAEDEQARAGQDDAAQDP
jgi:hypothetical protein